ncbi:MAG: hypothetical protein M3N13_02375 [Candidatus Eremiobacteraeota bacterium]|nr:hypothetical protein [Candidatus Eremiobacteraeota bacterium]
MPHSIADWATILGLVITFVNLVLIARTKRQIDVAVRSARFDFSKGALVAHCNDAISALSALRLMTRNAQWRDASDKCQDVRRAILQAKAAAGAIDLPEKEIGRLIKVLTQISTVEQQAELALRDSKRVSVDAILKILVKQNENVTTVLSVAGATYND